VIFLAVMPYGVISGYQCFREMYYCNLHASSELGWDVRHLYSVW
jgi:hypothetical protein